MPDSAVIEAHRAAGRSFRAGGLDGFVRDEGDGEPVVCMHGVPASSFLYRKLLVELADHGMRGIAFDLPGLGLCERPRDFDYSWTGLGRYSVAAVDALKLDRFHLVVHDIGGPVGFELAAAAGDRVMSLTILNTMIEVDTFNRPWTMQPFVVPGLRRAWLASLSPALFRRLMFLQGIGDRTSVTAEELDAYVHLLKRGDGGKAFLKIMRGFERTPDKRRRYLEVITDLRPRVQVIWGKDDPALPVEPFGEIARRAAGVSEIQTLPGKHFIPEEQAPQIGRRIVDHVRRIQRRPSV